MEEIAVEASRPEEGQKGLGFGHRRGGTGRASYRRPPEDRRPEGSHLRNFPKGKRVASATSKAPGAKRKVESMRDKGAKRPASGKLHIDDGCMGGGGSLNKYNKRFTSSVESDLKNNNYGIGPNSGFDKSTREGIFHYCVFAHLDEDGDIEHAGSADGPGYFLVIYDVPLTNQAVEFMHELGHNLIGVYEPGNSDHNPQANHLHDRDGDGDKEHCLNDCSLKRGTDILHHGTRPVNYCSDCWNAIRYDGLDGSFT